MKAKNKFGGGVKKKTRKTKKSASRKIKSTLLRCIKAGNGLYLKPYKQTEEGIKKSKEEKKNHKTLIEIIIKSPFDRFQPLIS